MMQILNFLKDNLNIDIFIVLIVFLSGFFQEKYLIAFKLSKDERYDKALKTLALSFIVSWIYIYVVYSNEKIVSKNNGEAVDPINWARYLISYFTATSVYDLAIRPFRNALKKAFGEKDGE